MALKVGCDIVSISIFRDRLSETGDLLPERIFHPDECAGATVETLAGRFAAKEAVLKALGMPAGTWQQLWVKHDDRGAPLILFIEPKPWVHEITVSISHNNDFAIAVVVAVLE
ncbi:MAG: holo-ACP synthase [Methylococcales bacterium]